MVGEFKTVRKGHEMTNRKMFFTMLWGAVFRRRSRAVMAGGGGGGGGGTRVAPSALW